MAALEPHLRGADRARAVFERVRNGDASVADLYAEDGVVLAGDRQRRGSRDDPRLLREDDGVDPAAAPGPDRARNTDSTFFAVILEVPTTNGWSPHARPLHHRRRGHPSARDLQPTDRLTATMADALLLLHLQRGIVARFGAGAQDTIGTARVALDHGPRPRRPRAPRPHGVPARGCPSSAPPGRASS